MLRDVTTAMTGAGLWLAVLAVGCSSTESRPPSHNNGETQPKAERHVEPASPSVESPAKDDPSMIPDPTLSPIDGAETSPLPQNVILRFQHIYAGEGAAGNYRFTVDADGGVRYQANGPTYDEVAPNLWEQAYPTAPSALLDAAAMNSLRELVAQHDFFSLEAGYRRDGKTFGGDMEILEIRLDGSQHRVIVGPSVSHGAVDAIRDDVLRRSGLTPP